MAFKPRLKIHYSTFSKGDLMSQGIFYIVPFSKSLLFFRERTQIE